MKTGKSKTYKQKMETTLAQTLVLALWMPMPEDEGDASHLAWAADGTKEARAGEEENSCCGMGRDTFAVCKYEMFSGDP